MYPATWCQLQPCIRLIFGGWTSISPQFVVANALFLSLSKVWCCSNHPTGKCTMRTANCNWLGSWRRCLAPWKSSRMNNMSMVSGQFCSWIIWILWSKRKPPKNHQWYQPIWVSTMIFLMDGGSFGLPWWLSYIPSHKNWSHGGLNSSLRRCLCGGYSLLMSFAMAKMVSEWDVWAHNS